VVDLVSKIRLIYRDILDSLMNCPLDDVIDKKERLFQTYIILFGLLLSFNKFSNALSSDQTSGVQRLVMIWFLMFMFFGLIYYVFLTRFSQNTPRICFDGLALLMGYTFSGAFSTIMGSFGALSVWLFYIFFCIMTFLIAVSLFV
jgi:hypothetical protein